MTVLVTGATGFIGGNVARALWQRGEKVRALVRPGANDIAIRGTGVQQFVGDLLDMDSLHRGGGGLRFGISLRRSVYVLVPAPGRHLRCQRPGDSQRHRDCPQGWHASRSIYEFGIHDWMAGCSREGQRHAFAGQRRNSGQPETARGTL